MAVPKCLDSFRRKNPGACSVQKSVYYGIGGDSTISPSVTPNFGFIRCETFLPPNFGFILYETLLPPNFGFIRFENISRQNSHLFPRFLSLIPSLDLRVISLNRVSTHGTLVYLHICIVKLIRFSKQRRQAVVIAFSFSLSLPPLYFFSRNCDRFFPML